MMLQTGFSKIRSGQLNYVWLPMDYCKAEN
jgi:hypothetical protein